MPSAGRIEVRAKDTWTADPEFWADVVRMGRHRFLIVTARRNTLENTQDIQAGLDVHGCGHLRIVCTGLASKLHHVQKLGIEVDVWIDDNPRALVNGH